VQAEDGLPEPVLSDPDARMSLPYPTVDTFADHLKRAGWSTAESSIHWPNGATTWVVTASRAGRQVEGRGETPAEAWHRAGLRAEALGADTRFWVL
jgi:hypothetical protein